MTALPAPTDARGLPTRDGAGALARSVCELAEGVPLQATVTATRRRVTRLGNGVALYSSEIDDVRVLVRAVIDGAEGAAFTNQLDAASLRRAVAEAVAAARVSPAVADHPGLPGPREAGEVVSAESWDVATALGDPEAEAAAVAGALERARAHDARLAGVVVRTAQAVAVANTRGLVRTHRGTAAQARLIASCGLATGHGGTLRARQQDVDLAALATRAARVAWQGREPHDLAPGRYDVVLEPPAVIELMEWLGTIAFGSKSLADGTSFLAGRLGESITSDRVTLFDPGPEAEELPVPFDLEGVARRPVTFVEAGVGRGVVHDRHSAVRAGCGSTGHWGLSERFPEPGARPGAVVLAPGEDGDRLVEKLEHGLHIQRFHYVNGFLDPARARMTGLTRDGVFEIRDGEAVRAVRDLRFTEDILDAFGRLDGLGGSLAAVGTFWNEVSGAYRAPEVLLRDFAFTGTCAP